MPLSMLQAKTGVATLVSDNLTCINTWGAYMFDPKFSDEPELRNKIFCLWYSAQLDSIEGEMRYLGACRETAAHHGSAGLVAACDMAGGFISTIKEMLEIFSKDDQITIRYLRDQWVHCWLKNRLPDPGTGQEKPFQTKYLAIIPLR